MGLAVNQILRWWGGGLRSSVWSKNKGDRAPRAPPLDPPLVSNDCSTKLT